MKTRYVLRFDPGHAHRAGRHEIEVRLRGGRHGKVHCRRAYFAPAGPERPAGDAGVGPRRHS